MGKQMGSRKQTLYVAALAVCFPAAGICQVLMGGSGQPGTFRMFPSDMAILEAGEVRKDLPCSAVSSKPLLGFDLRYHAGFEVSIPLQELAGGENVLTIVFRVTPLE
ncbi:MAG: hypothetical protein H7039_13675, partial [Bryobacteraceae bacterium]|nr:hypothetical protein [Bryobacteraceae bacterium]